MEVWQEAMAMGHAVMEAMDSEPGGGRRSSQETTPAPAPETALPEGSADDESTDSSEYVMESDSSCTDADEHPQGKRVGRSADHDRWKEQYDKVKRFHDQHKRWPRQNYHAEEDALGRWCSAQRKMKSGKVKVMSAKARVAMLDKINFSWTTKKEQWELHLDQAKAFYANHGVWPTKKKQGKLGVWCERQRSAAINGDISDERRKMLCDAGITLGWVPVAERWDLYFKELQAFHAKHSRWPYEREGQLGSWCARQRQARKGNVSAKMSDARAAKLDDIGFDWGSAISPADQWEARFKELQKFAKDEQRWPKIRENAPYRTLGRWCYKQKQAKRNRGNCRITPDQIAKLDSIGFDCLPGGLKRPR